MAKNFFGKKSVKYSRPFDVVQDGEKQLFVERVGEYDRETRSFIPSRDFTFRIKGTGQTFNVTEEMDAGDAYHAWQNSKKEQAKQEGEHSAKKEKAIQCTLTQDGDDDDDYEDVYVCAYHSSFYGRNVLTGEGVKLNWKCLKCNMDLRDGLKLLDNERKAEILDRLMENMCELERTRTRG